jgi:hypothetical protein
MRDDIRLLPAGKPQLDQRGGGERGDKQDAEGVHAVLIPHD